MVYVLVLYIQMLLACNIIAIAIRIFNQFLSGIRLRHNLTTSQQKSHVKRKRVFGHMRTTKAQTSLCISAFWPRPSLGQLPGWYFAHAQADLKLRILRMFEGTFSLDASNIFAVATTLGIAAISESYFGDGFCLREWFYHNFITKTCLYNFDPLKPQFLCSITGVYNGIHYFSYFCSKT